MKQWQHIPLVVSRILLGLVFIFSGFVKVVDPWGTAIKLGEYFNAFHMEGLAPMRYVLSIGQSALEMLLGFMLVFNLRSKLMAWGALIFMAFFTVLTAVIYATNPVSDCGCFGDAIKLTNRQTLLKNIVLLVMAVVVWSGYSRKPLRDGRGKREWGIVAGFAVLSAGIGVYCQMHLPLIDFLPYKVGVNIPEAMSIPPGAPEGVYKTTLIYRDLQDGKTREFEVNDPAWQDSTRWEFVDVRTVEIVPGYVPPIADFAIFDDRGDNVTDLLFEHDGRLNAFVVDDLTKLTDRDAEIIRNRAVEAFGKGERVVCLTASSLDLARSFQARTLPEIACYNIDGVVLKTMLRAHRGLVLIDGGTIVGKWNLRDVPRASRHSGILISEQSASPHSEFLLCSNKEMKR